MVEEKWQWITDLTDDSVSSGAEEDTSHFHLGNDNYDDADWEEQQVAFVMSGSDFPREEERVGRVLGFLAALLFWTVVSALYVSATWGR